MEDKQIASKKEEMESLMVIGIFLGVFGVTVLVAIFFTETYHGKITNLISGGLLLLCAGIAIAKAFMDRRKKDRA